MVAKDKSLDCVALLIYYFVADIMRWLKCGVMVVSNDIDVSSVDEEV